ncbi:MAG: septal ring lytic transglycosylase RlpA family protein [Ghiorsea sp.]
MRLWLCSILALLILTACAPTRYPVGYHQNKNNNSQSADPHVGEGGVVKRGNPYQIDGQWYYPLASGASYDETGIASWYGKKFHGKKTANGEIYDMHAMTAAHTTLPIPSVVRVTNLENGKAIEVRVNDRGPFVKSRLIDLSYAAAKALGYSQQGTTRVRVQTIHSADVSSEIVSPRPITASIATQLITPIATPITAIERASVVGKKQNEPKIEMAYVQIGAFSSKDSAEAVIERLKNNRELVHVMPVGQLYRVRVGPFDLDSEAEVVLKNVHDEGYNRAMIIHD